MKPEIFSVAAELEVLACTPSEVAVNNIWSQIRSSAEELHGDIRCFKSSLQLLQLCFTVKLEKYFQDYETSLDLQQHKDEGVASLLQECNQEQLQRADVTSAALIIAGL